jgi:hypothetical protein
VIDDVTGVNCGRAEPLDPDPEPADNGPDRDAGEPFEGDDCEGSTDIRSISWLSLSRSQSTKPPFGLDCFAASMAPSSDPPSLRRLLTNVSTFLCRLSTVSFISE